jgi:GNAT superfamily N-acetyltransferase
LRGVFGFRLDLYLRDLRDLPQSAAIGWREAGLRGIWSELRNLTLDRLYRTIRLVALEQKLDRARDIPPPADVEIRMLAATDLPGLRDIIRPRALRRFERRLATTGRRCFAAYRDGRVIGYTWSSDLVEPDLETFPLPLPSDAVYCCDLYVVPRERNKGLGSALVSARMADARARGFRRCWRVVERSNRASLRTVEKTGGDARVVGEASFQKTLGRTRARYTPHPALP